MMDSVVKRGVRIPNEYAGMMKRCCKNIQVCCKCGAHPLAMPNMPPLPMSVFFSPPKCKADINEKVSGRGCAPLERTCRDAVSVEKRG